MTDAPEPTRKCPECGEVLNPDASLCRHCGFAFGTTAPTGAASTPIPPGQASVWETIELIFPLRKVAIVAGGLVVCLLLLLTLTKFGGTWANRQIDEAFIQITQRAVPEAAQVIAQNGKCTVHIAADPPTDPGPSRLKADQLATTYQKYRLARGATGPVTVMIYYNQTLVATIVKQ